jgi:molecular chaperone GrpE
MAEREKKHTEQTSPGKEPSPNVETTTSTRPATAEQGSTAELQSKVAELEQALAGTKDQLLRKAAEFENYKKRVEGDFALIEKFSNEQIITGLLPVLDDFRRFLKSTRNGSDFEAFYKGVDLIFSKFMKLLEARGLREVESEGKPFDVHFHEALLQIPKTDVAPHTIVEEVEKGYTLNGKVVRHAKVIVAGEPEPAAARPMENPQNSADGEQRNSTATSDPQYDKAPDTSD